MKFKVGDIVSGTPDTPYMMVNQDFTGKIEKYHSSNETYDVSVLGHETIKLPEELIGDVLEGIPEENLMIKE